MAESVEEDPLHQLPSTGGKAHYAVADGYAWSGGTANPSGGSSTSDKLRVGFKTASGNYRTLIKFDLSSIPAGATITSADLKLYYYHYAGTVGDPLDLSVYRTTVDWNEGYLSWSKAENYHSFSYDTVTIIVGSGAGYKTWDITALVQNWVDGTYSNYGVLLRAPTQSGSSIYRQFHSKEYGSNVPKLEVTYTEIPTPVITGINPPEPVASPTRQWISILGTGFVSDSTVTLRIGSSEYPIPSDRTDFRSSTEIRVYVGLTDPGTWSAQVTNPVNCLSNIFSFTVVPEIPTPVITGINPPEPVASPTRQWISILGTGFVSDSTVTLRIGSETYPIPSDRTDFRSSAEIRVYVGLTDPGTWSAQVTNPVNCLSNIFSFTVIPPNQVTAAIDQQILDLIDQYAGSYYNSGWNLNINQYKAWVATIAWAEGGRGGYVAHSQYGGGTMGDRFDHRAVGSDFRFSTGIGPFQLDRGSTENWEFWPTIDKLDPEKTVKSVLRLHYNTFRAGADLEYLAENSRWCAVNPNYGGDPAGHWNAVTGTNWNYHKNGKTELDWSNIKDQLAQNADNPDFLYENNVRSSGTVKWNIKESEGIQTDTGKKVIFDGYYLTWLITARGWGGTELFEYYYTYRSDENIEIWVWDNSYDPINKFRYIFVREYSTGPFPERRDGNIAGETLTSPAIGEAEPPTAIIDSITPDPAVQGTDTVSFSGHGTDTDGTVVAYNWRSGIDGQLSTSAAFTKPASELSVGTHTIYFKVQDDDGAWSTEDTEDLTINPANNPPTAIIDSITPDPAVQVSDTVSFSGHGTDTDGTVVAYNWRSGIDGQLSTSAAFTKPASELSVGTHTIYFKVQDDDGAWSTEDTEDLTINPANVPPTAIIDSITPDPAVQGTDTVSFSGHGTDTDGTVVAYNWRSGIDGQLSTSAAFTKPASELSVGTHTIYFKVQDDDGAWSTEDTEDLTINPANNPPTAIIDSITPDPAVQVSDTVSFSGHGTDTDGTVVAYNWRSGIDGQLSTSAAFTKPASELSVGTHTIYFKVQDNDGAWSTEDTEDLTINPLGNNPPTAIIDSITPDPAVQGSDTVSFSGHGTDPDGTVEAYNWRSGIDGQLSTSAAFTKPASELSVGTHTIYFKVQDNDGAWSTEDTEDLTINPANNPPTAIIDSITPDPAVQGSDTVSFTGHGTDPDGTVEAYNWRSGIDGQLSTSAAFTKPASELSVGTHTIYFKVQDNDGAWSTEDTEDLTINPADENDWGVRLDVTCGAEPTDAEFGLNEAATDGFDQQFDVPLPPSPPYPPYQEAYFYYPGNPVIKRLSTSYIPPDPEGNIWPFQLNYNADEASDVTITWNADDIAAVPADTPLFFVADSERINMRTTPSYTFSATTGTYEFEITTEDIVCEYTFELFTGWNTISFPIEPSDKNPDTIFGPDYYYLYTWDPVSGSYVSVGEVETNRGYWLLVLEDRSVTVHGECIYEYCTSLTQGWNMIGSIFYTTTVPDGTETNPADQMYQNLYAWSVDHYVLTQDIEPGVGYWALAYVDCELCVFPAPPPPPPPSSTLQALSLVSLGAQVPRDSNNFLGLRRAFNDWGVKLDVTCGAGPTDAEFGLNEAATDGFDQQFDVPLPPSPPYPPYQEAYFYYPENPVIKRLSTSYIPPHSPECNIWPFRLNYNADDASDVTITWNAADIAAVPTNCSLLFVNDSEEIDMRTTPSYKFSATTGTYEFEIRACCGDEKPDLVITDKWLCWPDNCTICYNVTNIGKGTAHACHNTALYVDGVAVAHDHVPVDLAPGESYTACFDGYVWTYTPPSDNITVCADNSETLDELDEDNNYLANIWMCGDVTGDGRVRTSDGIRIFHHLTYGVPIDNMWAADVTGDGRVRTSDGIRIFHHLTYGVPLNCKCGG